MQVKMIKAKKIQKISENPNYYNASNYISTLLMQSNQQHHLLLELYARKTHKENNEISKLANSFNHG